MGEYLVAKIIVLGVIVAIFTALAIGFYNLISKKGNPKRTAYALAVRIALSLFLFVGLIFAFSQGWLRPHTL